MKISVYVADTDVPGNAVVFDLPLIEKMPRGDRDALIRRTLSTWERATGETVYHWTDETNKDGLQWYVTYYGWNGRKIHFASGTLSMTQAREYACRVWRDILSEEERSFCLTFYMAFCSPDAVGDPMEDNAIEIYDFVNMMGTHRDID